MPHAIRWGYAATPRGPIHYAEAGEGPALLLLHSTPRSWRMYRHLLPVLAPHFRAIAVDAPGYGNSHPLPETTSMPWMAESLVLLLDALGLEKAHVFGLHTGNKLAAAMACHWPQRLDRMVFAGQTHSIITEGPERNRAIREFCDKYFPAYAPSADGAHLLRDWVAVHANVQGFWWPQRLQTGNPLTEADIAVAETRVTEYLLGWRSIVPTYRAILDFDLVEALRRAPTPTLVLEFLTAREAHFGSQAEAICALMQRATPGYLHEADGTHVETHPEQVLAAILPFLKG